MPTQRTAFITDAVLMIMRADPSVPEQTANAFCEGFLFSSLHELPEGIELVDICDAFFTAFPEFWEFAAENAQE